MVDDVTVDVVRMARYVIISAAHFVLPRGISFAISRAVCAAVTADGPDGPESTSWHARSLGISFMQPFVFGTALGAATRIKGLEAMLSGPLVLLLLHYSLIFVVFKKNMKLRISFF
jgi:hypothetical protein